MKRTPLRRRTWLHRGAPLRRAGGLRRRGRSRFPKRRDRDYCAFVRAHPCLLAGRVTRVRLAPYDVPAAGGWAHVCWGPVDVAHVNATQARGAPDVGETVPLCRAAHRALDQRLGPAEFAWVTGLDLSGIAAGLALAYAGRGGAP